MERSLRRVITSGKGNNCFVYALATNLLVYANTDTYEGRFIRAKVLELSEQIRAFKGPHQIDDLFEKDKQKFNAQAQILKLGEILREFGSYLVQSDAEQKPENRQYNNELRQEFLNAWNGYRGKSPDCYRDDTFAGMSFIEEKFKSMSDGGVISEPYINNTQQELLEAFKKYCYSGNNEDVFCGDDVPAFTDIRLFTNMSLVKDKFRSLYCHRQDATISDEELKLATESLMEWWALIEWWDTFGYKRYGEELAKVGVPLLPYIGNIITARLGLNLALLNEGCGGFTYANVPMDVPSLYLYRSGKGDAAHWEACLPAELVKKFNKNKTTTKLTLARASLQDNTYLGFLTEDQQLVFKHCFDNDDSHDSEHIKFGRAFAACYGIEESKVSKFAEAYKDHIAAGCGRIASVATALFEQTECDPALGACFKAYFGSIEDISFDSGFGSANNSEVDFDPDPDPKNHVSNREVSASDKSRFVEGFVASACRSAISKDYLVEAACFYAMAIEDDDDGPEMEDDLMTDGKSEFSQDLINDCLYKANALIKTQQQWREQAQSNVYDMYNKNSLFQHKGIRVINKIEVATDSVAYELNLKNGLMLRRSTIDSHLDCPAQILIQAHLGANKKLIVPQAFEAIARAFMMERCYKLKKTQNKLTDADASITLFFIDPPDKMEACKAAFLKVGFKNVTYEPAVKKLEAKKPVDQSCRSEVSSPMSRMSRMGMGC